MTFTYTKGRLTDTDITLGTGGFRISKETKKEVLRLKRLKLPRDEIAMLCGISITSASRILNK